MVPGSDKYNYHYYYIFIINILILSIAQGSEELILMGQE